MPGANPYADLAGDGANPYADLAVAADNPYADLAGFKRGTTLLEAPQQGDVIPREGYGVRVNPVATGNAGLEALKRAPGEAYDAAMTQLFTVANAVGGQKMADAVDAWKAMDANAIEAVASGRANPENSMTPAIQEALKAQSRPPTTGEQIAAGSQSVAAGALNFLGTPVGLASLPLAGAPSVIQKGAGALFLADMARHAPEAVDAAAAATYEGDVFDKTVAYGNLATLGVMSGAIGKHLAAPGPKAQTILAMRTMLEKGDIIGATAFSKEVPVEQFRFEEMARAPIQIEPVPRTLAEPDVAAPQFGRGQTTGLLEEPAPALATGYLRDRLKPAADPLSPPAPVENPSIAAAPTRPELRPEAGGESIAPPAEPAPAPVPAPAFKPDMDAALKLAEEKGLTVELTDAEGNTTTALLEGRKARNALKRQSGTRESLSKILDCLGL